jgi:hypothetical protein
MSQRPSQTFLDCMKRYSEAVDYLRVNAAALEADPAKYERVKKNMEVKVIKLLDEAWDALSARERENFSSMYFLKRHPNDPGVIEAKRYAAEVNGKIVSFEENKK